MGPGFLLPALAAASLAGAPPPSGDAPSEPVVLHSDRAERAAALREEFAPDEDACPNSVGSVTLVIPITSGERLFGYAFVTPRLCLARGVSEFTVTSQMHFIIDQMVRAAHRTPMALNDDMSVDQSRTNAAMLQAAQNVVGERRIEQLQLLGNDVRALR